MRDLAPPTNPLRETPVGRQLVAVDTETGEITPFVKAEGISRPFDVQFGPDDALYIVDYGVVNIDPELKPPYAVESLGLLVLGGMALAGAAAGTVLILRRRAEDG